jgi:hypothetical protein
MEENVVTRYLQHPKIVTDSGTQVLLSGNHSCTSAGMYRFQTETTLADDMLSTETLPITNRLYFLFFFEGTMPRTRQWHPPGMMRRWRNSRRRQWTSHRGLLFLTRQYLRSTELGLHLRKSQELPSLRRMY